MQIGSPGSDQTEECRTPCAFDSRTDPESIESGSWWSGRGKPPLAWRDWKVLSGLGFSGYYLASFLDFAGLQYISASLERLILYLNPTVVK